MSITKTLSEFSANIQLDRLPPEVVERARYLVLDLVGNMVRARVDAESTPPLFAAAKALGLDHGDCAVFGEARGWSPAGAALLNGALAHSLDFDDTHAAGSLHPGAPVIPAALVAGEMAGATGAEVLAAIVAGYEVTCRVALALPAGAHYQRGFHPTATCGAFGAAAAAGRIFGLSGDEIASAMGIALSQSAGSLQFLANGAWTKRFQVGWAAMAGLTAATLAREGFKGAAFALEGKAGFLAAYAPAPIPERAVEDLGVVFELMKTAVKPYPSCRYGHAGIDAMLALRAEHKFKPEEIEGITYGTSRSGMILVGEPREKRIDPQNVVDGQFSGPFVLATALATGAMGWDSYAELQNPVIRALLPKVMCEDDPEIEREFPANMSGKVTVRARGQVFTKTVVVPKGEPDNFLSEAELKAKFAGLVDSVLGVERSTALANAALAIDTCNDVGSLARMSVPTA